MFLRALFRRREIWFPTVWGWLAMLLAGLAIIALVARNLHGFLALNQPVGAPILVVEGWLDQAGLDQAASVIRSRRYERVVTTGGPIEHWPGSHTHATFADRAAAYLITQQGLARELVTSVPAPASAHDRTYLSALMVREWAKRSGFALDTLDVLSSATHARRSRLLYQLALGQNVTVGVFAVRSTDYDPDAWWKTSAGARDVLDQAIALLWVKCFFWPARAASNQ